MVTKMTARAISPLNHKADMAHGRVLLLTDNSEHAVTIRAVLESAGLAPIGVCTDPNTALRMVRDLRPDLVLAAVFFDGEPHGIELSRKIQEDHGTPVIYLGEAEDPLLVLQIAMTQPVGLISDPSDAVYLRAVVSRALRVGRPSPVAGPY